MRTKSRIRLPWGVALAAGALAVSGCNASSDLSGLEDFLRHRDSLLPPSQVDTLLSRTYSGIEESRREVLVSEAEWEELWTRAHAHLSPAPEVPPVELDGHVLVLAALGTRNTGGYSVAIRGVARDGDDLVVWVEERRPGSGCFVTLALTAPLVVVRVPAFEGTARFVETEVTFSC